MNLLVMARAHLRMVARQKALWFSAIPLILFAWLLAVISPKQPGTGGVEDLAFTGQMVAMFSGLAYSTAFTDYFTKSSALGMDELEYSTPVSALKRRAAQLIGTLGVILLPSIVVIVCTSLKQSFSGHPWALVAGLTVIVTIIMPSALIAMSLSALAGTLLPRVVGRVAGVLVWLLLLFSTPLIPLPTPNGTIFAINGDVVASGFFGNHPFYRPAGPLANHGTAWEATFSLVFQLVLVFIVLVFCSALTGRARKR